MRKRERDRKREGDKYFGAKKFFPCLTTERKIQMESLSSRIFGF